MATIGLTDPELDLLLETLDEDPRNAVLPQVGRELLRRRRFSEAAAILERGLPGARAEVAAPAHRLLARARYELGDAAGALKALDGAGPDDVDAMRLRILCLERRGAFDLARQLAVEHLMRDPRDVVITAVIERISAPVPEGGQRGADPFYTVERAERYAQQGRVDRAIRTYRRILLYHPGDLGLLGRLRQLASEAIFVEDDLSEELADPDLVGGEPLAMPEPPLRQSTPMPAQPAIASTPGGTARR